MSQISQSCSRLDKFLFCDVRRDCADYSLFHLLYGSAADAVLLCLSVQLL